MKVSDIWGLVTIAYYAKRGQPGQKLENTPQGKAMQDVVREVLARPDLKEQNLALLELGKAFDYVVRDILPGMSDDYATKKGFSFRPEKEKEKTELAVYEKGTTEKYDKGGPTQDTGAVVADYYERLGLSKDATDVEIKTARVRLMQEYHPDVLTAQGKSPEEIAIALEKAKDINEAYYYLSKPERRAEYDKIWEQKYSKNAKAKSSTNKETPLLGGSEETNSSYIAVSFTPSTNKKPSTGSLAQTQNFQQVVMEQGAAGVNPFFISELKLAGLLPEGFSESQLTNAVHLYSRGIKSEDLLTATENTSFLSEDEIGELNKTALFMEYMETSENSGIPGSDVVGNATGQPSFLMTQSENPVTPSQNTISFKRNEGGGLSFVFDEAGGFIKDKAGGFIKKEGEKIAAKTAIGKALKEGGKKVLKEGSKVLAKTGVKIAGKAALSAFFESLNAIAPGLGTLADVVLNYVVPFLFNLAVSFFKSFTDPEKLAQLLALTAVGLAGFGMGTGALFAGGAGAFSYFKSMKGQNYLKSMGGTFGALSGATAAALAAVVAAIGMPILIALVIIPLSIAFVLFIITSGAYVVPSHMYPGDPDSQNRYVEIKKTIRPKDTTKCRSADNSESYIKCRNNELPLIVVYTVTVKALRGPLIDVEITDTCRVERQASGPSNCPPPTNINTGTAIPPTSFPINPPGNSVSPSAPFVFTYERNFDPGITYYDSLDTDTVTVTATSSEANNITTSASAGMCVGNCPQNCPTIWPVTSGYVTQGPDGTYSHNRVEAIDISTGSSGQPVFATHGGIVQLINDSCEGNVIMISSTCNGTAFNSRYSHLGTRGVQNGATVVKGQEIGTLDNTGSAYCRGGAHLHYEFRDGQGGSSRAFRMEPPNIPEPILPNRSCCNFCGPFCTTDIP